MEVEVSRLPILLRERKEIRGRETVDSRLLLKPSSPLMCFRKIYGIVQRLRSSSSSTIWSKHWGTGTIRLIL